MLKTRILGVVLLQFKAMIFGVEV